MGNFFARARSNSLHSLSSSSSSIRRQDESAPPPVPSIPTTFSQPSPVRGPAPPSARDTVACIRSVSVPHHAKSGGKWVFACRVVPDGCAGGSQEAVSMTRAGSLGRMQIAGTGSDGAREPHTVWRSWGEFVDFSTRLSTAFPFVTPDGSSSPTSPTSPGTLPSSFYRQTPRLTRKLTLFVTRSTLLQRQDDLDLFVRRLFEMPDVIRRSSFVVDFFRIREHDVLGASAPVSATSGESLPPSPLDDEGPASFARFLTDVHSPSPNATIRATTVRAKSRPALGVKHSTPDLRKLMVSDAESIFEAPPKVPMRRPLLADHRTVTLDDDVRSSAYSASSSATVTPASLSRLPSPLTTRSPLPSTFVEAQDVALAAGTAQSAAKARHQGLLRHFYSLQDIRGQQALSGGPSPPLPTSSSVDMGRSQTQPNSASPMARVASQDRYHAQPRQRTTSKSSSSSSLEEASGSAYTSSNGVWPATGNFRQGPSGRTERVPSETRPRRTSAQGRSLSNAKAGSGHSPSASSSSIGSTYSTTSARSSSISSPGGYFPSRRSSTDQSEGGSYSPGTPPTPHFEGDFHGGKFHVSETGVLSLSNTPVPPSMSSVGMQHAYSHDGMPHASHARKVSYEARSRATSSASSRPSALDLLPGSPLSSSVSSVSSARSTVSNTSAANSPRDRPTIMFKVLHPAENLLLRVPRETTLATLRAQIAEKFAMGGAVRLGGEDGEEQWALSYIPGGRGAGDKAEPAELIVSEADYQLALACTSHLEKVALRIIS
ncbi:hypothetical protein RQP46_004411 [Phenoliferia psychrophenolica]